jgi:putative copper resistance protein D
VASRAGAAAEAGLAWGVLGLFVLQFAFLSRRFRMLSASVGSALLIYAAVLVSTNVATDAYPSTYFRPTVAYSAISVAGGKLLYEMNCQDCHGRSGHGDGPASEGLLPRPADLTGLHANSHTVGDLFWWISKGVPNTPMRGFEDRLSEDDRWDLINFVRVLSAASRAQALGPVIEDHPWLVAPDFAYATSAGENSALKDKRGDKLVLLVIAAGRESELRLKTLEAAAPRLGAAGVEIIVVPPEHGIGGGTRLPRVTEGNVEILATYALFAARQSGEARGDQALHAEFLIDKQGYLRARWLPEESAAWIDPDAITVQAERLLKEVPLQLAPEEHVH